MFLVKKKHIVNRGLWGHSAGCWGSSGVHRRLRGQRAAWPGAALLEEQQLRSFHWKATWRKWPHFRWIDVIDVDGDDDINYINWELMLFLVRRFEIVGILAIVRFCIKLTNSSHGNGKHNMCICNMISVGHIHPFHSAKLFRWIVDITFQRKTFRHFVAMQSLWKFLDQLAATGTLSGVKL